MLLRLILGDAVDNTVAWQWGGILNEVALLLFMVIVVYRLFLHKPTRRRTRSAAA